MAQSGTLFDMLGTDEKSKRQASRARSIDNLSNIGGLAAQPQTPMAAATAGLGVTIDQAKMAGSSAQLNAAPIVAPPKGPSATGVAQGTAAEQQLSQELIRQQGVTQASAGDLALRKMAEEWDGTVGSLGQRVAANLGGAIADQMTQTTAGAAVSSDDIIAGLPPDKQTAVKDGIAALNAATTPAERNAAIDAIETGLGGDDTLAAGVVGPILSSIDHTAYSAYLARKLPETVSVAQLNAHAAQDGTDPVLDVAALSTQLGLDAAAIEGMNVKQIKAAIDAKLEASFSTGDKLRSQLGNTSLSETDRADIRQQLTDLGETGIAVTEAEMADLQKKMASAGDITLPDGSTLAIEDVLNDASFTELMGKVLDGDAAAIAELQSIPELNDFYNANKALVDAAYAKTITDSKDWNTIEDAQESMVTTFTAAPSVLAALRAAAGVTSTTGPIYDTAAWQSMLDSTVMKMVTNPTLTVAARTKVVSDLGSALEVGGLSLDDIAAYTPEDLKALGFGDSADPGKFATAMTTIKALSDPASSPDALIDAMIPDNSITFTDVVTNLTAQMGTIGLLGGTPPALLTLLDADKDNVISAEELRAGLAKPSVLGSVLKLGATAYDPVNPFESIPGFTNNDIPGGLGEILRNVTTDGQTSMDELTAALRASPAVLSDSAGLNAVSAIPGLAAAIRNAITPIEKAEAESAGSSFKSKLDSLASERDAFVQRVGGIGAVTARPDLVKQYNAYITRSKALLTEYGKAAEGVQNKYAAINTASHNNISLASVLDSYFQSKGMLSEVAYIQPGSLAISEVPAGAVLPALNLPSNSGSGPRGSNLGGGSIL